MSFQSPISAAYHLPARGVTAPAVTVPGVSQYLLTAGKALWTVGLAGLAVWAWAHTWYLP